MSREEKFINHIKKHLKEEEKVICTICKKTVDEIYEEKAVEEELKKEDIKEGEVYENKKTRMHIHIKEITYFNDRYNSIASIVTSDECNFYGDSKATVGRNVWSFSGFRGRFKKDSKKEEGEVEEKKTLSDKKITEEGFRRGIEFIKDNALNFDDVRESLKRIVKRFNVIGGKLILRVDAVEIIKDEVGEELM